MSFKLIAASAAMLAGAGTFSSSILADAGHAPTVGEPGRTSDASRTVEVVLHDNYFEPENLSVKAGETVRFVVRNEGQFVHEFNIGTPATHADHQHQMAMMMEHGALMPQHIDEEAMKMDMGNGQTMEHDDPNSVLLEPGQSQELVWRFSGDADLEFACNVPGHYAAGMVGNIKIGG